MAREGEDKKKKKINCGGQVEKNEAATLIGTDAPTSGLLLSFPLLLHQNALAGEFKFLFVFFVFVALLNEMLVGASLILLWISSSVDSHHPSSPPPPP